jgi:hypothetical protein
LLIVFVTATVSSKFLTFGLTLVSQYHKAIFAATSGLSANSGRLIKSNHNASLAIR